jgi:hypothetical protein
MTTEPTLIYAHMTPAEALALAAEITRTAKACQKQAKAGLRECYGYVHTSIMAKRNEFKVRIRVSDSTD